MSEPKDFVMNRLELCRSLSDEYYSRSPDSKAIIKAIAEGTSPTSRRRSSFVGIPEMKTKYLQSDKCERNLMAYYGMVTADYHNQNKNVERKYQSK